MNKDFDTGWLPAGLWLGRLLIFSYIFLSLIGVRVLQGEGNVFDISDTGESDFLKQFLFISLLLFILAYVFLRNVKIHITIYHVYILLFFLYAALSVTWSNVPFVSFKRYVLTSIVFIIPLLLSILYKPSFVLDSVMWSLAILIMISFFAALVHPYGVHTYSALDADLVGAWKGIFTHKNRAGSVAAFTAGLFLIRYLVGGGKINLFFGFFCLLFLVGTISKTSMLIFLPAMILSFVFVRFSNLLKWNYLIPMLFIASPVILIFMNYIYGLVLNPESFTGRSEIWSVVMMIILDNPFFGVGVASVYHVGDASILLNYADNWVSLEAHAHNGYLDIALYFGVFGFIGFFYSFYRTFYLLLMHRLRVFGGDVIAYSSFFAFFFFIFHNLSESSFFDTSRPGWVFISIFISILLSSHVKILKSG